MSFIKSFFVSLMTILSSGSGTKPNPPNPAQIRAKELRQAEPWIMWFFTIGFIICGVASGYATFTGIRLFLDEVGGTTFIVNGTAIILTIAVSTILTTGWAVIVKWGPEAPTTFLRLCMVKLGLLLFAITLSVSSVSNLMTLAGPAAKVHDWRLTQQKAAAHINEIERRSLGIQTIRPSWVAERDKTCAAADAERINGTVSASGRGAGPVVAALDGICALTKSFVKSIDDAVVRTDKAALKARGSLAAMRMAIRDRSRPVIEREDLFLDAGDILNSALQQIRVSDLTKTLDVGARQVEASVAKLSDDSVFSRKQVEAVASIKEGLSGLVLATKALSEDLRAKETSEFKPVDSPDYIAAILAHAPRFVSVFAAAIGIDTFMLWSLGFMLVHKAGYRAADKQAAQSKSKATSTPRKPVKRRKSTLPATTTTRANKAVTTSKTNSTKGNTND